VNRTTWIDRSFPHDFPLGSLPNVLERLRGTPSRLEELIGKIPAELLTRHTEGKWSIQEHVGHLGYLEELHDGRIDDFLNRAQVLRAADMTNEKTTKANHNGRPIGELLIAFRSGREQFVRRIERLDETTLSFPSVHPRLKHPMRVADVAFFVAEHDDHHLTSIRELWQLFRS
jgi:uncharacterized damage-inducible protein DinB